MRVIDHRQFAHARNSQQPRSWRRIVTISVVTVFLTVAIVNIVLWALYRDRVLPNYYVGATPVNGLHYDELDTKITAQGVLLPTMSLQAENGRSVGFSPAKSGITPDIPATIAALKAARPVLPMMSMLTKHTVPLKVTVDDAVFTKVAVDMQKIFAKEPIGNHVVYKDGTFKAAGPEVGYALDVTGFKTSLTRAVERGETPARVPLTTLPAPVSSADVNPQVQQLQRQLEAAITVVSSGKTTKASKAEIGSWYVAEGNSMNASRERIAQYVTSTAKTDGITPANTDDAVTAITYALTKNQTLNFRLIASGTTPLYRYCVAQRGLDDSVLAALKLKLAATYGDTRGWNDKGRIGFVYSEAGCQLRVWLAAPSAMTSFGSICDDYYSCTVFPNVIINNDRWVGATDPWNAQHLNIEEYDAMVINHESGHWLGFDHVTCPGAGLPAPVMQQQSVNLGGCTFNAWPLTSEASAAAR